MLAAAINDELDDEVCWTATGILSSCMYKLLLLSPVSIGLLLPALDEHEELVVQDEDDDPGRLPRISTGEAERACRKVDILRTVACFITPALCPEAGVGVLTMIDPP